MPEEKPQSPPRPKRKLPTTLIAVAGVALVEAGGFVAFMKLSGAGGPAAVHGASEEHYVEAEAPVASQPGTVEVPLLTKFRVPNAKSGRLYIYDFDLVAKVAAPRKAEVEKMVADHAAEISDVVARIVRSADPRVLQEDELKALRLQILHAVGEIARDTELIEQILIPRCVPMRSE